MRIFVTALLVMMIGASLASAQTYSFILSTGKGVAFLSRYCNVGEKIAETIVSYSELRDVSFMEWDTSAMFVRKDSSYWEIIANTSKGMENKVFQLVMTDGAFEVHYLGEVKHPDSRFHYVTSEVFDTTWIVYTDATTQSTQVGPGSLRPYAPKYTVENLIFQNGWFDPKLRVMILTGSSSSKSTDTKWVVLNITSGQVLYSTQSPWKSSFSFTGAWDSIRQMMVGYLTDRENPSNIQTIAWDIVKKETKVVHTGSLGSLWAKLGFDKEPQYLGYDPSSSTLYGYTPSNHLTGNFTIVGIQPFARTKLIYNCTFTVDDGSSEIKHPKVMPSYWL